MLTDYERQQITKLRLEKAESTLREVEVLIQRELWTGAIQLQE